MKAQEKERNFVPGAIIRLLYNLGIIRSSNHRYRLTHRIYELCTEMRPNKYWARKD